MEILHIILNWFIPCVCTALVALVTKQLKCIKNNICNKDTYQITPVLALSGLFVEYTALGGNHGVSKLVEQVYELPPIKK